jgi:hypothetical protein
MFGNIKYHYILYFILIKKDNILNKMSTEDEQIYNFLLELIDIKDGLEINDSLTTTNFVSSVKEFLFDERGIYNENIIIKYLSIKELLKFIEYYESQKNKNVIKVLKDFVDLTDNDKIRNNIHLRFLNNLLEFYDDDTSKFHESLSTFKNKNYNNIFLKTMIDTFFPRDQNSLFLLSDFLQYYKSCKEENIKIVAFSLFDEYRKEITKQSIDLLNKLLKISDRTNLETKIDKLKRDKNLESHIKRLLDLLNPSKYRESIKELRDGLLSFEIDLNEPVDVEKILKRNKGLNVSRKNAMDALKNVIEEDEEDEERDEEESDKEIDFEVEVDEEDGGKIHYEEDDTEKFKNPSGIKFKNVDDVLKYYKELENQSYIKPLISWIVFKKDNPNERDDEEYIQIVNFLINNNQIYTSFSLSKITKFKKYNNLLLEESETPSSNIIFVNLKEGEYKPWNTFLINSYEMLEKFDTEFFSSKIKIIDPDDIYVLDYIEKKSIKEERELTNCNEIFTNIELIREWVPSSLEYSQRGIDDIKIYIIEKGNEKNSQYYNNLVNPVNYKGSLYYRASDSFIGLYCDSIKIQDKTELIINESIDKISIFKILYITSVNVIVNNESSMRIYIHLQDENIFDRQQKLIEKLNLPKEELYMIYINDIKINKKQIGNTFKNRVKQVGLNRLSSLKNKEGNNTEMIELINNSFYEKSETLGKYALYISRLCIFFENWNRNSVFVSSVKNFDYNPENLIVKQPRTISKLIKEYSPEIGPSYEKTIEKMLATTVDNICLELYSSINNNMDIFLNFFKTSRPVIPVNIYKNYMKNIKQSLRLFEEEYKNKESIFEYDQDLRSFQFEGIENIIELKLKELEENETGKERINRILTQSFRNIPIKESSSEYSSSEDSDSE